MTLRTYRHTFTAAAPLARVAAFHQDAGSMAAITPPPILVQMQRAPQQLQSGAEMAFTLWLGPLPLRWLARIENVTLPGAAAHAGDSAGFVDRQVRGPFASWVHTHTFVAVDAHTTLIVDEVEAEIKRHPWWGLVGMGMWLGLPALFAFRAWKTRRLLRQPAARAG